MALILVTWRDAFHDFDDCPTPTDFLVETAGFGKVEVNPTKKFHKVAAEKTPEGKRGITHIPTESIISIRQLR